jgi:hypothetical protein
MVNFDPEARSSGTVQCRMCTIPLDLTSSSRFAIRFQPGGIEILLFSISVYTGQEDHQTSITKRTEALPQG